MNRLIDISEIHTGYNFRSTTKTDRQMVYLISAKDLGADFRDLDEIRIPSSYDNYLRDGDILVKSRGVNHEAQVFRAPDSNRRYVAANTIVVVRPKSENYKPSYIAQIINSDGAQQFLRSLSFGQTVPSLSPSSLGTLNCPKIPLEKQNQIEIVAEAIDEYRVTLTRYVEAGEELTKALKNQLMKGVK